MRANTPEAVWARVDTSGQCWLWTGRVNRDGYGDVSVRQRRWLTHRYLWTITYGPIPDGACILHHCDVPACTRPSHLYVGTRANNNADTRERGRLNPARGDANGSRTRPDRQVRGSRHGMARLSEADVVRVRARVAAGETQRGVAQSLDVSPALICRIVKRQLWPHLP